MGYLLKEALKTLCGVNQWSYAVFWKIGCQNPKLLIWEECYYGPVTCSKLPTTSRIKKPDVAFDEWEASWVSSEALNSRLGVQPGERVQLLVNKIMMENHVNVVGEGLVGRAAFTGNYQWILSQNCTSKSLPPEVLTELRYQFSAGLQTVAVIPVLPHGVLQLGSSSAIMENTGFVNDVKTLILQLGCVPGALFSDSYATKEPTTKLGATVGFGKSPLTGSTGKSKVTDLSHFTSYTSENYHSQGTPSASKGLGETSNIASRQIQDNLQSTGSSFQYPRTSFMTNGQAKVILGKRQLETGVANAEFIPSNSEVWLNQDASIQIPGPRMNYEPSNYGGLRFLEQQMLVDDVGRDNINNRLNDSSIYSSEWRSNGGLVSSSHEGSSSVVSHELFDMHNVLRSHVSGATNASSLPRVHRLANTNITSDRMSGLQNVTQYKMAVSNSGFAENLSVSQLVFDSSDHNHNFKGKKCTKAELDDGKAEESDICRAISIPHCQFNEPINLSGHIPGSVHYDQKQDSYRSMGLSDTQFENAYVPSQTSDDLFDILGLNCKNKIFYESYLYNGQGLNSQNLDNSNDASNKLQNVCYQSQLANQRTSDSGIFSVTGTDNLLDAVVSKVQSATKPNSSDNLSCTTMLTKLSSSSAVIASTSTLQANASNQMQDELEPFGLSNSLTKIGALGSCSFKSGSCKQDTGNYSQTSSFFGSEIGSWVEQGHDMKSSTSASTAYSKKTDETNKSNRKRLKPGENPRPRPKDRQMIQDRVKELREIVPNGVKCSIDALLEHTIKHMLFLQCVTKHADKLKQTGDSKIISEEGGLLLKDNFEGGATWAYEVGSQAMVRPIIVEDLNPPRQLLVEMLCEKRGLFLEIADIIRGLGLTILKGVMEARNDKIWARFVVEANRDVTRMEIFISLVRLLEQTVKSSSTPVNCIGNDNTSAHQPFPQATSIPATGMPCGFK